MIQLHGISLAFGGQQVLNDLTWTVRPGQRIGLIGPNGAGKSTLLKLIAGRLNPDEGTVSMGGSQSVGYLEQDAQESNTGRSVVDEAMTAFEETLSLEKQERDLTQLLASEIDHGSERYRRILLDLDRVHGILAAHESHLMRPRTEAVLAGLGFEASELDRPLETFSGGWRMRVALAKILLREPDFLLLDEPTNHLDIVSIDWLESYLKSYRGTVVMVSHDRYFLDRMVTTIAELSRGRITEYAGNYEFYIDERQNRRTMQQAEYNNPQKLIADTQRFIERFRYKASKARQVQSRVKMLEKLERLEPPETEDPDIRIRFPEPRRSGKVVLEISRFSKAYESPDGPISVFRNAGPLQIERGDKIALIGKNGAGKSTLARILHGSESFDGDMRTGHNVETTFFAQHQADTLQPALTVLESLQELARGQNENELRTILGAFLFSGEDVFKPTHVLSGGEKSRVALARTLLRPANFLILDEPTNHLDMKSIRVLIEAMRQYRGSFVVVSHDRHFLDQVVNRVWYLEAGGITDYSGTYSEYRWYVQHGTKAVMRHVVEPAAPRADAEEVEGASSSGPKSKEQKRREAEDRNRRYRELQESGFSDADGLTPHQLKMLYERVESSILEAEERKEKLEEEMSDPEVYANPERSRAASAQYDLLKDELEGLYRQWEQLAGQVQG